MSNQNIYDNPDFFNGYRQHRTQTTNLNDLVEKPVLFSLLPDLTGRKVLDLGCGYGENCAKFVAMGAEKVIGIDISEKMLAVAEQENASDKISYLHLSMEHINEIVEIFDVVISSLALHYIKDFESLCENVSHLLNPNGIFLFSQSHPMTTCIEYNNYWTKDSNGKTLYANIINYSIERETHVLWYEQDVVMHHRKLSTIINTLTSSNFIIERMEEPVLSDEQINQYPQYAHKVHRPDFLFIKARKL